MSSDVTIIIPTLNEEGSIGQIIYELVDKFADVELEILIIDGGSCDSTLANIAEVKNTLQPVNSNSNIIVIQRVGASLFKSVLFGLQHCRTAMAIVIDGDGQHRVSDALRVYTKLKSSNVDVCIGARQLDMISSNELSVYRKNMSKFINMLLSNFVSHKTSDPLTGMFAVNVLKLDLQKLEDCDGFKILLEILLTHKNIAVEEMPITFDKRLVGESKLNIQTTLFFIAQVISHLSFRILPQRFILFGMVGVFLLSIHSLHFLAFSELFNIDPSVSHAFAVFCSSIFSFYINKKLTFNGLNLRFERETTALQLYIIINLLLTYPNFIVNKVLLDLLPLVPILAISIFSIPADTIMKYVVIRRFIWKS